MHESQLNRAAFKMLVKRSINDAKNKGHDPALISHQGALALFGCTKCRTIMEIWDTPNPTAHGLNEVLCMPQADLKLVPESEAPHDGEFEATAEAPKNNKGDG